MEKLSYHDVEVTFGMPPEKHKLMDLPFTFDLMCNRAAGWQLWTRVSLGADFVVGAEYDSNKPLKIEVRGHTILDTYKATDGTGP